MEVEAAERTDKIEWRGDAGPGAVLQTARENMSPDYLTIAPA